jgi:hypothetical protein
VYTKALMGIGEIAITVTAQDGSTDDYTFTVKEALSSEAQLLDVDVLDGNGKSLLEADAWDSASKKVTVPYETSFTGMPTIAVQVSDGASVQEEVGGTMTSWPLLAQPDATDTYTATKQLQRGEEISITVIVTAEDSTTEEEHTFTVSWKNTEALLKWIQIGVYEKDNENNTKTKDLNIQESSRMLECHFESYTAPNYEIFVGMQVSGGATVKIYEGDGIQSSQLLVDSDKFRYQNMMSGNDMLQTKDNFQMIREMLIVSVESQDGETTNEYYIELKSS